MKKSDIAPRQEIIETCVKMNAMGINQGTSGNVSVRVDGGILVTPSAVPYDNMKPDNIVFVNWEGNRDGDGVPSTEWRFHLDIARQREDVNAIVHTHSMYATILSIRGESIPAVHYMIAAVGGPTVRCGEYKTFGTPELSQQALEALEERNGCPARQSRRHRHRREPRQGFVVGERDRSTRTTICVFVATWRTEYFTRR